MEYMDRHVPFYVRVAVAIVAVPAITVFVTWLAIGLILGALNSGNLGLVRRRMKSVTPAVEQRDKEVEELTR
jgi:hypothetical protein